MKKGKSETSLIIIAMQNAFCNSKGSFQKRLSLRKERLLNLDTTIKSIKEVLIHARANKWLVIFTKLAYKSDYSDAGLLVHMLAPEIKEVQGYIENSWDSEIIQELVPLPGEVVLIKKRYDPFCNTELETILRRNSIRKVVVVGILTNVCVESCVRSALDRDFEVFVIKEATTTYSNKLYEATLQTLRNHFSKVISITELPNLT